MPRTTRTYDSSTGAYRLSCLTPGCVATSLTGDAASATRTSVDLSTGRPIHETFRFLGAGRGNSARCRSCEQARRRSRRVAGAARVPGMSRETLGRTRQFGVEFECAVPRGIDAYTVTSALSAAGLTTGRGTGWYVKGDGTIQVPGMSGVEVVSPPLSGDDGEEQIRTATRVLRGLGAKVNRSCGTHVHHDANDLTVEEIKSVARGWFRNQSLIDGLVSASRRSVGGSYYCQPLSDGEVAHIEGVATLNGMRSIRVQRYRTLNLVAYGRYGTIEVRQHQGTLDAEKVLSWVRLGQAILDTAKVAETLPEHSRMRDLFGALGDRLDETARTFLLGRTVEFGAVQA